MRLKEFKHELSTIILCGGKGKRLLPLTKVSPKPLIKIKNKEILIYIIEHLLSFKIKYISLSVGIHKNRFKNFVNRKKINKSTFIIDTGKNSDIIKRITNCEKYLKKYVLVCYGDTLVDLNLDKLIRFFNQNKNKFIFSGYKYKSNFGLLKINKNGNVVYFKEKPNLGYLFNIGFFLFKKDFIKKLNKFTTFKSFLENKKMIKQFKVFEHTGKHITVNTVKELLEAKKNIKHLRKYE